MKRAFVIATALFALASCGPPPPPETVTAGAAEPLEPRGSVAEDTSKKESLRMVPPEVTMRTYLQIFGGLSPMDAQRKAKGRDGNNVFDTWDDYIASLGFPDYKVDIPRQTQTNALMVATFERIGVALCDRALEHDLQGKNPPPIAERVVFAFDVPKTLLDDAAFAPRFDVMHRTFLGYPARLAPDTREKRFFTLYRDVANDHAEAAKKSQKTRFTPEEAGWAAVCYAFIRHPEFHLY